MICVDNLARDIDLERKDDHSSLLGLLELQPFKPSLLFEALLGVDVVVELLLLLLFCDWPSLVEDGEDILFLLSRFHNPKPEMKIFFLLTELTNFAMGEPNKYR